MSLPPKPSSGMKPVPLLTPDPPSGGEVKTAPAPVRSPSTPLRTTLSHVLAELSRLDLLLDQAVALKAEREGGEQATSDRSRPEVQNPQELLRQLVRIDKQTTKRLQAGLAGGAELRLVRLAEAFHLTGLDVDLLLLALAPELDGRYRQVFAYLQGERSLKRPTLELAQALLSGQLLTDPRLGSQNPNQRPGAHDAEMAPHSALVSVSRIVSAGLLDPRERFAVQARLEESAPLVGYQLVECLVDELDRFAPLPVRQLRVEARILAYLRGQDALPAVLERWVKLPALKTADPDTDPVEALTALGLEPTLAERLAQTVLDAAQIAMGNLTTLPLSPFDGGHLSDGGEGPAFFYLQGPESAGADVIVQTLCGQLLLPLLEVDGRTLLSLDAERFVLGLQALLREARLRGAALFWRGFELLHGLGGAAASAERNGLTPGVLEQRAERVLSQLKRWQPLVFASGTERWLPEAESLAGPFFPVTLSLPSTQLQRKLWRDALIRADAEPLTSDDALLETLVAQFSFHRSQILDAVRLARDQARWRSPESPRMTRLDVLEGCRLQSTPRLGQLAQRLETSRAWEDLILNPRGRSVMQELRTQLEHRAKVLHEWGFGARLSLGGGLCALFTGSPGTGKTLAASLLGRELGRDVYRIDLSSVVSKYIGETEKQLAQVFDEAESSAAILFFDEADALFGKRTEVKDAHDRYANIETSYLLQRIESFKGVVLLATNLRSNLDAAFVRRMSFIIPFEEPSATERLQIWTRIWPEQVPLSPELRLEQVASRFELTGGNIRNIALASAFQAASERSPVTLPMVLHAIRRELEKSGRVVDSRQFEAFSR